MGTLIRYANIIVMYRLVFRSIRLVSMKSVRQPTVNRFVFTGFSSNVNEIQTVPSEKPHDHPVALDFVEKPVIVSPEKTVENSFTTI